VVILAMRSRADQGNDHVDGQIPEQSKRLSASEKRNG
jgi:multicomponent K+:H+ antiporter subunit C